VDRHRQRLRPVPLRRGTGPTLGGNHATSTRIDDGEGYDLHLDLFGPEKVYLTHRGENLEFAARAGSVTGAVPAAVWDHIRKIDAAAKEAASWTRADDDQDLALRRQAEAIAPGRVQLAAMIDRREPPRR
jgi:hypothetical protein